MRHLNMYLPQDARMAIFTRFSHLTLAATLLIGSLGICGNLVSVAIFARREVAIAFTELNLVFPQQICLPAGQELLQRHPDCFEPERQPAHCVGDAGEPEELLGGVLPRCPHPHLPTLPLPILQVNQGADSGGKALFMFQEYPE